MELRCTYCGGNQLLPGFIEDAGTRSKGYLRWIQGPLERSLVGTASRLGKPRATIHAHVCPTCSHVEMFAVKEA